MLIIVFLAIKLKALASSVCYPVLFKLIYDIIGAGLPSQ